MTDILYCCVSKSLAASFPQVVERCITSWVSQGRQPQSAKGMLLFSMQI